MHVFGTVSIRAVSRLRRTLLALSFVVLYGGPWAFAAERGPAGGGNWPGWRGDGSGISDQTNLPVYWSETENIVWSRPLPGEGNSSPIVWEERVFVTASTEKGQSRLVICLNASTGKVIWETKIAATKKTRTYPKSGYASPTPVTDGQRVYVFFDSPGLVALDMKGNILWTRPLGPFNSPYNMAGSPILYKDLIILCCDHQGESFIIAIDRAANKIRWRRKRETTIHYSTPLLIKTGGRAQIVVNAEPIVSYDADTGEPIWSCRGMKPCVTPSVVFSNGLVYATSGRNGPAVTIDPSGKGDITDTHVRMHVATGGPYVPSPLVVGPYLLLPNDNGTMRFVDRSGKVVIKHRLPDHFTASPVLADGKIYWTSERKKQQGDNKTYVIDVSKIASAKPAIKVLSVNRLKGRCIASPAIAGGRIFVRTDQALYCIAGTALAKAPVSPTLLAGSFAELKKRYEAHPASEGDDVAVRLEIVEAMAKLKDPNVMPFLLHVAKKEPHWDICEQAAKLLGAYGEAATDGLIELLADYRSFVKIIAAGHLGRLKAVKSASALIEVSRHKDPLVRSASLESLGQIGQVQTAGIGKTIDALIAGLTDGSGVVRQTAIDAVAKVAAKAGKRRDQIVKGLLDCLADRNPLAAEKARKALTDVYKISPAVINTDEILYGEQRKDSVIANLRAGPVRLKFQDGELRYLYVGDKQIVRRVYFAVRDSRWDTVIPELTNIKIQKGQNSFTISFDATCANDIADYTWHGRIVGTADGKITFNAAGEANVDFKSPRIGLNILYGCESLAGQAFEVVDEKGKVTEGKFPTHLSPKLLVNRARTLRYTTADGMTVICDLPEGVFGMEDQRSYGDSSYKAFNGISYTYPNVSKGKKGGQTFTLEVKNARPKADRRGPIRVRIGKVIEGAKMPKIFSGKTSKPSGNISNIIRKRNSGPETIAWSFCPALHLFDDDMYMENITVVVDQVGTVRSFAPKSKILINPIRIDAPYPRAGRDPRNNGLFAGAWSAGLIKYLALAGVDEAGFRVGPHHGRQVQEELAKYAGWNLLAADVQTTGPSAIEVLAVDDAGRRVIWLINKTDRRQQVVVDRRAPVELTPFEVHKLSTAE